jgi:adenine-specific DNA-methyltransferase
VRWHAWRWSRAKIQSDVDDLEFEVSGDSLRIRTKIRDVEGIAVKDLVIGPSTVTGQADLEALGLARVFDTPKPVSLLQLLVSSTTDNADLVVDFFAGAGSTAHAVALQNEADGGRRRCITVNLPEPTPEESDAAQSGFATVSAITRQRLTKVVETVDGARLLGLRAFKLVASSFREAAATDPADLFDLGEKTLLDQEPDLNAIAAEVLLKEGVELGAEWDRRSAGGDVVIVAHGVAVVLSRDITDDVVAEALGLEARVVVFLEDGFAGKDSVKANAFTNARNAGITMKTV